MKISIIVPIYNSDKYLNRCLDSIIGQTYNNIEIILINDGSTDNSLKICEEYKFKDSRIRIINKSKNEGQVSAYISGLNIATGDAVGFVDSDDWIDISMFEKLAMSMIQNEASMVVCGCKKIYENDIKNEPKDFNQFNESYLNDEILKYSINMFSKDNFISDFAKFYRCNKIIKKDILIKNLKYVNTEIKVFEDNCLILPCILDSIKIACVKEYLYFYVQREGSTMNLFDKKVITTNRKVIDTIDNIFMERNIIHDTSREVIMCTLFSLDMILKSDKGYKSKIKYLNELNNDILCLQHIDTSYYNFKIKVTLRLLYLKLYRSILVLYIIHTKIRDWLKKYEK